MAANPNQNNLNTKICYINIRGLTNKRHDILNFLTNEQIDILGCAETFLKPEEVSNFKNFNIFRLDRVNRQGGGLAFLVRRDLTAKVIYAYNDPWEVQILILRVREMDITLIYNPPNNIIEKETLENLQNNMGPSFIIIGDFNSHNALWGSEHNSRNSEEIVEFALNHNWNILNDGSITRIGTNNQRSATIDLAFCSNDLALITLFNMTNENFGSDHILMELKVLNKITKNKNPKPALNTSTRKFNTKLANWEGFREQMKIHTDSIEKLTEAIMNAAKKNMKKITVKKQKPKVKPAPWWDLECQNWVNLRRKTISEILSGPTVDKMNELTAVNKRIKVIFKEKKKESFTEFCASFDRDTPYSTIWEKLRIFKTGFLQRIYTSPFNEEQEDLFLAHNYPPMPNWNRKIHYFPQEEDFFTQEELQYAMKNSKSTPGMDGISHDMIFNLPEDRKTDLLKIINNYIRNNDVPEVIKDSLVCPILKPNKNPEEIKSFRPIMLTSCFAKLIEKMITNRLTWFLESKNLLNKYQYGFRQGKGTTDAISCLISTIMNNLSSKQISLVTFLDIKAAYDNVDHATLIDMLIINGFSPALTSLINNLITDRRIFCRSQSANYNFRLARKGLPQGSPLSPILFNFYITKIWNHVEETTLIGYADDLTLINKAKNIEELAENVDQTIKQISDALEEMGLEISMDKTKNMVFTTRKNVNPIPTITINNTNIELVNNFKYLGVMIDNKLNFKNFMNTQVAKAQRNLNVLKALGGVGWGANPTILINLYKSIVRSHLEYNTFLISSEIKHYWTKMESIQTKASKFCLGLMRTTPNSVALFEAGLPPINIRIKFLANKYSAKILQYPKEPIYETLTTAERLIEKKKYWHKKHIPTLLQQFIRNKRTLNLNTMEGPLCFKTPLKVQLNKYNIHLNEFKNASDIEIPKIFTEIIDKKYKNARIFYTDGSVKPNTNTTGFAVYEPTENIRASGRLPNNTSIFLAESYALLTALQQIKENNLHEALVVSDSKSLLTTLNRPCFNINSRPTVNQMKQMLWDFKTESRMVHLMWVPAHKGIKGNEIVDELAKKGEDKPLNDIKLEAMEHTKTFTKIMINEWQRNWETIDREKGKEYRENNKKVKLTPWFKKYPNLPREIIVFTNRLRSNHTLTPKHLSRLGIADSPLCACGQMGDLNHIFFGCQITKEKTNILIDKLISNNIQLPCSIYTLLEVPPISTICILFHFVKALKIKL